MNPTSNPLTLDELQHQNQQQSQHLRQLELQNKELALKLKWYEERLRLATHQHLGASSDKTHPDQLELNLFNEAEDEALPEQPEPTVETITCIRKNVPRPTRGQAGGTAPGQAIVTAPMPKSIQPGSLASPSAVAHILNQKYGQGVPLYRLEQELHRQGVDLSRQPRPIG